MTRRPISKLPKNTLNAVSNNPPDILYFAMLDRSIPPKVSHFSNIEIPPEESFSLDNGINLHIVRNNQMELSKVDLIWEGGYLDYPDRAAAKVMSATMQEATNRLSGSQVADIVDYSGGVLVGNGSPHHSHLSLIAVSSQLDGLIPLLAELAAHSSFPENAVVASARRQAVNISLQLEQVAFRASKALGAILKGEKHPDSRIWLPEEMERVTRNDVVEIYNLLRKSQLHIFVGGRIDDKAYECLLKLFGSLDAPELHPIKLVDYAPESPQRKHIAMESSLQSAVAMGVPTIGRSHPDYILLRLAVMALGGYFGSRLMANIREEKGLTYGINASLLGTREGAFMEIIAQCDERYVEMVISETIKEIENLSKNPPVGEELERLRLHAWMQLASATDSTFGILDHYATRLVVGTPPDYFRQQLETLRTLSSDDIARVASRWLSPSLLSIVTAGR